MNTQKLSNVPLNEFRAFLEKIGYIKRITENIFEFKNSLVWSYVYANAKEDKDILPAQKALLNEICKRTVSSPAIPSLLAQITGEKELAFKLWTMSLKLASYIGDVSFYTMCQKQSLILCLKKEENSILIYHM